MSEYRPPSMMDMLSQALRDANRADKTDLTAGAISGGLGAPVDIVSMGMDAIPGVDMPSPEKVVGSSEWFGNTFSNADVNSGEFLAGQFLTPDAGDAMKLAGLAGTFIPMSKLNDEKWGEVKDVQEASQNADHPLAYALRNGQRTTDEGQPIVNINGAWGVEVNDSAAKLNKEWGIPDAEYATSHVGEQLDHPELYRALIDDAGFREMPLAKTNVDYRNHTGNLGATNRARADAARNIDSSFENLSDEEILKEIGNAKGYFNPNGDGMIALIKDPRAKFDGLTDTTMLHEGQHAIEHNTGMVKDSRDIPWHLRQQEQRAKLTQLRRGWSPAMQRAYPLPQHMADEATRLLGDTPTITAQVTEDYSRRALERAANARGATAKDRDALTFFNEGGDARPDIVLEGTYTKDKMDKMLSDYKKQVSFDDPY